VPVGVLVGWLAVASDEGKSSAQLASPSVPQPPTKGKGEGEGGARRFPGVSQSSSIHLLVDGRFCLARVRFCPGAVQREV
jgi:hypothetical protein